jgi:hypothetical protein
VNEIAAVWMPWNTAVSFRCSDKFSLHGVGYGACGDLDDLHDEQEMFDYISKERMSVRTYIHTYA